MKETLLIVDDNVKWCTSLVQNFEQRGYHTYYATTGKEALKLLSKHTTHAVLLDIMLGEENGLDVLKTFRLLYKSLPVIMITGFGSIDTAVRSIKLGAFDYMTKPLDFEKLLKMVEHAIHSAHCSEESYTSRADKAPIRLITQNAGMLELCERVKKFARTDLPMLIRGENGTGKEILADFIHLHSPRSSRQILKINCAAFPETLLDNELFGHEKGAYTGADTTFEGVFERAHKGSLFLDEIGDMPLTIQAKILRTLQHHEIRRIGGSTTVKIDVRFIAATNKDLHALIQKNQFREDLFYRLNVATIQVPPLRKHKEDIPLLAEYFLSEYSRMHSTSAKSISDPVMTMLVQHDWPGNVRELKNTINYAATVSTHEVISIADLPPHFQHLPPQPVPTTNIREDMERQLILDMLQKTNYNKKKTAEILNMSRNTLYNKLEKYGIMTPK